MIKDIELDLFVNIYAIISKLKNNFTCKLLIELKLFRNFKVIIFWDNLE